MRAERSPLKRRLMLFLDAALFGVALWVLRRVLTQYRYQDIVDAVSTIGLKLMALSLLLTVLGYAALIGYDYVSLRLVGQPMPIRRMWIPSFVSFAVANSAPVSILTGTGVRYRLFSDIGLSSKDTAKMAGANVLTYLLGLLTLAGFSFVFAPVPIPAKLHLPITSLRPFGVGFLGVAGLVLLGSSVGIKRLRFWRWRMELPTGGMVRAQVAVSLADWLLSSSALYVLMLAAGPVSYPRFLSGFLLAQIVTQVVPLPGGIGVFEAVILLLRPPGTSAPLVTGALLLYRVGYYLLPLIAAGGLLAWQASRGETTLGESARRIIKGWAPHLFAVLTFLVGAFLLLFGALPAGPGRLVWLGRIMPTAVIEGSRFLGSLVGVGMVLLAWGLERRIWGAYRLTVGLLILGIPGALLRVDYGSAMLLLLLLGVLYGGRRAFDRRTALSGEPLDAGWGLAAVLALVSVAWLTEFSIRHQAFSSEPFWRFAVKESAPPALRMAVAGMVALVVFVGVRLLVHVRKRIQHPPIKAGGSPPVTHK